MRLGQVADHLWLTTYAPLSPQDLEKFPFDRLWACVFFIFTEVLANLAGKEPNHQRILLPPSA